MPLETPPNERALNEFVDVETTVLSGEAKDGGDLVQLVVADLTGATNSSHGRNAPKESGEPNTDKEDLTPTVTQ